MEKSRMLSGEVEWSMHGSRALWEGKAIILGVFCLGKLRQGVFGNYKHRGCQSHIQVFILS